MRISLAVLVLSCLFAWRAPSLAGAGITDPDYYWHVGYGEWILQHGYLPTTDFWSWTFDGQAYRLTQWLGEVIMGLANLAGGSIGTSILAALLATLTLSASYRAARRVLDNRLTALLVALVCDLTLLSLACRPHQFTHLGLALLTWLLASYQNGNHRALYWIPPLFAVWVNLHGGYAFGLAYLGTIALLFALVNPESIAPRVHALPLSIAFSAALVATLLNPYGWGAWQYALKIAQLKSSSAGIIDEWAATSIKTELGLNFFAVISVLSAAMAATRVRPMVNQILTAFFLAAIGWSAVRLSLMSAILMAPLLATAVRDTPFHDLVFGGKARKYDRTVHAGIGLCAFVLVLMASVSLARVDTATERHMAEKLPVVETAFIQNHALSGRILNTPESGGYLIRQLGTKVSIDTRYDLYGDRAFFELLFALRGDAGWKDYVARLDPDIVLLNNPSPLRYLLSEQGMYRAIFEGPAYTVLIRQGQRPDLPTVSMKPTNRAVFDTLAS
jgi:hypothetical protein